MKSTLDWLAQDWEELEGGIKKCTDQAVPYKRQLVTYYVGVGALIDHDTDYLYYDFLGLLQPVQTKPAVIHSIPDALSKDRLHSEWLMPSLRKLQMNK
jgi:hypothetical protein